MKGIFRHKIVGRFMAGYLIVLLIPLLAGGVTYRRTYRVLEDQLLAANRDSLETCGDILDMEIAALERIVKRLVTDPQIATFLSTPLDGKGSSDIMKVIRASRSLYSYSIRDELILDVFLHSRLNDIIITTNRVHTELERDYPAFYRFGERNYGEWKNKYLLQYYQRRFFPAAEVVMDRRSRSVITYAQSVPFDSREYAKGTILALIDTDRLDRIIHRTVREEGGMFSLIAPDGTVLHRSGEDLPTYPDAGSDFLVTRRSSPTTALTLVMVFPSSVVGEKLTYMKTLYGLAAAFFLLVGIVASFLLSYFSSRPLIELSDFVQNHVPAEFDGDDLAYIRSNLRDLVDRNRELVDRRRAQLPLMRQAMLLRLIHGEFRKESSLGPALAYGDLQFPAGPFNVALFSLQGFGRHVSGDILVERDLVRMILEHEVHRRFPGWGYFAAVGDDRIAWLFAEGSGGDAKEGLAAVRRCMEEEHGYSLLVARGRPTASLHRLEASYLDAKQGMEYLQIGRREGGICHFDEIPPRDGRHSYDLDTESRLILATRCGRKEEAEAILSHLFRENFSQRSLSVRAMNLLLDALENTALRIGDYLMDGTKRPGMREGNLSATERFGMIRERFGELCAGARRSNETRGADQREAVLNYVTRNFADASLNLSRAADHFGFKESYFYHYFLDAVGQSFSAYLEGMRMDAARAALAEGGATIDRIAEQVGYNSAHSFRRAFKRSTGLSPSQYQDSISPSSSPP